MWFKCRCVSSKNGVNKKNQSTGLYMCFAFLGVAFSEIYAASKFAIEGFCEGMSLQLLKFNIM